MAKKTAKKNKPTKKAPPKRHVWTQEERLLQLIEISEKQITGHGSSIDELFQNQANRARKELEELRAKKK